MAKTLMKKRHNARRYALQALYQWSFHDMPAKQLLKEFIPDPAISMTEDVDRAYFQALVNGTLAELSSLDETISVCLDRSPSSLNRVERMVLRLAVYELLHRLEIPSVVVIDQAIELAKEFGAQGGYKYVNGVLDAIVIRMGSRRESQAPQPSNSL